MVALDSLLNIVNGPNYNPKIFTPASCCAACRDTDGCNAWVFCNAKGGCGGKGSCTAYVKSLPTTEVAGNPDRPYPIPGFVQCTTDGRWPFRSCSLKTVKDPKKPPVYGAGVRVWHIVLPT